MRVEIVPTRPDLPLLRRYWFLAPREFALNEAKPSVDQILKVD
jgi:hypothetical protein